MVRNLSPILAFVSLRNDAAMDLQLNWTTCFAVAGYVMANPPVRSSIAWAGRTALMVNWKRMAVPAYIALLVLAFVMEAPAVAQSRRGSARQPSGKATGTDPSLTAAVATFDGVVRAVSKKELAIDLDGGNSVEFKLSKKTEYYVGAKPGQAKDLVLEANVKVEGSKDVFGVLTASKVTVKPQSP